MTWATPHPGVVVIDPDAGRPALIGSCWRRRTPEGDDPYDEIVVRGCFDLGERNGGLELVVSPRSFGPTLTASPESLSENYVRVDADDDLPERLSGHLRALEARTG